MSVITDSQVPKISFNDIQLATENFKNFIGKGAFGNVYKGELKISGRLTFVAVKRLPENNPFGQGNKEFFTEIQMLSRYKHPNLVALVGACNEGKERILIYEYAEHGSLDMYLSIKTIRHPLTWKQRINICIDAARGLDYLHNHVAENLRVIHRDIKSANILLDHNWKAMIADLGLSKTGSRNESVSYVVTNVVGTPGYLDPVYRNNEILTKESDVYSFGMVMFEVICGRLANEKVDDDRRLFQVVRSYYEQGKLKQIVHPYLKDQTDSESFNKISRIAYQCTENEGRPLVGLVLRELEEALKLHVQTPIEKIEEEMRQKLHNELNVRATTIYERERAIEKLETTKEQEKTKQKWRKEIETRERAIEDRETKMYRREKAMEDRETKMYNREKAMENRETNMYNRETAMYTREVAMDKRENK